jgi:hypothetical protein
MRLEAALNNIVKAGVLFGSEYLFYREAGTKAVLCLTIDDPSAIALSRA